MTSGRPRTSRSGQVQGGEERGAECTVRYSSTAATKPTTQMAAYRRIGVAPLVIGLIEACEHSHDDEQEHAAACERVVLEGEATDEVCLTMLDGEGRAQTSDQAPTISLPTEGQVFTAGDAPPRFAWTSPIAIAPVRKQSAPFLERFVSLFVSNADAHEPPVTDDVYALKITIPGRDEPYRVFTTELEWQVDDTLWAALGEAADKTISLAMVSAYLTENRITEGPFQSDSARQFSVTAAP